MTGDGLCFLPNGDEHREQAASPLHACGRE
jgi:hypothetical protein